MINYELYPSKVNFESIISVNKILKANIIVYDKKFKTIYGYCQDNADSNVLKIFTPTNSLDFTLKYLDCFQLDFPNFVAFSKDVSAIYKIASVNDARIGIDVLNYRGIDEDFAIRFGCKAFRTTIIDEERPCFDVIPYREKMMSIIEEMGVTPNSEVYSNILSIEEFKNALSVSASKGIQTVRYNNNVYFIPPTFINNTKGDVIDLICKNNLSNNTKLMNFRIKKSSGIVDVIYRQMNVNL